MSTLPKVLLGHVTDIADTEGLMDYDVQAELRDFNGENYLGDIFKIKLYGNCNGAKKCVPLLAKNSPRDSETRTSMFVKEYYNSEIYLYTKILKTFDGLQAKYGLNELEKLKAPKFYSSSLQEMGEFVILEDLSYKGYTMSPDRREPLDYDHIALIVHNLAKLHALSFVLQKECPELFREFSNHIPNTENYGSFIMNLTSISFEKTIPKVKNEVNKSILVNLSKDIQNIFEGTLNATKTHPYNVICHGDAYRNNCLFKYENGRVVENMLIDWQMIRFASPVTDLAYAICLSTHQHAESLPKLLDFYYKTLSHNVDKMGQQIQDCYPKTEFDRQVKELFKFGLVFAVMSIPFQLKHPGKETNVQEITNNMNNGELEVDIHEEVIERIEALVTDFVQLGLI